MLQESHTVGPANHLRNAVRLTEMTVAAGRIFGM